MSTYAEFAFRDGSVAPGVAFGVGTALHQKSCVEEVKSALKVGFKHFDLAEVYETTPYVGQALKEAGVDPKTLYSTSRMALTSCADTLATFAPECRRVHIS